MLKKTFTIFISRSFLLSIVFLLSACSGHSPSDSSRLSSGPDGEYIGWHCEGAIESSDNWNCSEQLLKGGELVSPVQVEAEAVELNNSEPAEITLDTSVPDTDLAEEEGAIDKPLIKVLAFDISAKGYTVQLGAYLSQKMAEQAADNISLTEGELVVRDIVDGERYLFVLVYGQYPSRQQAEIVTQELIELNPGLNFWIRSIKSMRERD
jgi:hypothetical protein